MGRGSRETEQVIPGLYALSVGASDMPAPEGWRWVKLTDIARLESGHTPSRQHPEYWDGDVPWVGIKDARLHHGNTILSTLQTITEEGLANSAARWLPAETVCLSRTASVGYVTILGKPMATSQDFVNWICSDAIDPKFLMNLILAEGDHILKFGKGSTHTTIYFPEAQAFHVCIPSVPQQRRIVTRIEALTARSRRAKEALDAIPALIERFRKSVLAAAFRGDLTADWREKNPDIEPAEELLKRIRAERRRRWEEAELAKMRAKGKVPGDDRWKERYEEPEPVDASELPELPEGWAWATWAQVGFCQNGRPFPSSEYASSGTKLLRPGNLHAAGELEWTADNTKYLPEEFEKENPDHIVGPYELVMNLTAQSLKDEFLGRICISPSDERCLLNQRLARLTPVLLPARFCLWLFKSPLVRSYIDKLNTGSLIQHMFTSQVEQFAIPIPPLEEQSQIARHTDAAMGSINRVQLNIQEAFDRLKELDSATLAKAFRGELVSQDPNDEPASALLERLRVESAQNGRTSNGANRRRKAAAPELTESVAKATNLVPSPQNRAPRSARR